MKSIGFVLAAIGAFIALPGVALNALGLRLAGEQPSKPNPLADVTIYYADEETADRLTHMAEMGCVGYFDPRSEWRTKN